MVGKGEGEMMGRVKGMGWVGRGKGDGGEGREGENRAVRGGRGWWEGR